MLHLFHMKDGSVLAIISGCIYLKTKLKSLKIHHHQGGSALGLRSAVRTPAPDAMKVVASVGHQG